MNLTVSELMLAFLQDRSFAGRLANALPHISEKGIGTMCIGVRNGRVILFTDPEFVKRVSLPFGRFCMEHEILGHYANAHIPRFIEFLSRYPKPEDKVKAKTVFQVAVDCATNSMLRKSKTFPIADKEMLAYSKWKNPELEIPEDVEGGLITPDRYGLPHDESLEFYLQELMHRTGLGRRCTVEQIEFYQWLCKTFQLGGGPFHVKWFSDSELKTMSPEELNSLAHQLHNHTKFILRRVVDEVRKARGTIPGGLAEWLDEYLADPIIPWWEIFITRIRATRQSKADRGIQQPNRTLLAMAEEDPSILTSIGVVRDATWQIFTIRDVSGSMGKESCHIGYSELQHMLDLEENMVIRDMQFDAAVQTDVVYKNGDKISTEITGRGGTDFSVAFDYMKRYLGNSETEPDAVIVFTDGGAPAVNIQDQLPPETPVIWCITPDGSGRHLHNAGYGEVIVCDPDQSKMWQFEHESVAGGDDNDDY